jgi:hypothetical protein
VIDQLGKDAWGLLGGVLIMMLAAVIFPAVTAAFGALIFGAIGALAGGAGAAPGAVVGADLGYAFGEGILAWAGLLMLADFVLSRIGGMRQELEKGIDLAWGSKDDPCSIDLAARDFARAFAYLASLIVMAIISFVTLRASKGGATKALESMKDSLLFKRSPRFSNWLIENFGPLRTKFFPLGKGDFEFLGDLTKEGDLIPNLQAGETVGKTSVPMRFRIRVRERVYDVIRDEDKIIVNKQTGEKGPKGPTSKHLGEKAADKPWASFTQTDFPMYVLADALDQAEAQLMFQPPNPAAMPRGIPYWEIKIDTTKPIWRVEHAKYSKAPQW